MQPRKSLPGLVTNVSVQAAPAEMFFHREVIMQENWQGKDLSCLFVKVK